MNALWAIVIDTWRQSRQQAVFLIMLGILALIAILATALPKPIEDGGETRIGFVWSDQPTYELEEAWTAIYAQTLVLNSGEPVDMMDPDALAERNEQMMEAFDEAVAKVDVPPAQRSMEVIVYGIASAVFSISMILFLAACSGYFPNMLEAGAVDIVLARPIDRLRIFLGKYLGGMALYAAAITAVYFLIFLGVGVRTGVWVSRIFLAVPLQIFAAGVLYAILAALGVIRRSATLCMVVGLLFYLVVDSILGSLMQMQRMNVFTEMPWLDGIAKTMRHTLPNFGMLKESATASVLNMPLMDWQPILVAAAWLVLALALGYWRFNKTDY